MSRNESGPSALLKVVLPIIATAELPDVGPNVRANVKSTSQLQGEFDLIFFQTKVAPSAESLIRAAGLLWHDHLEEAHVIVQDGESADAAFIHGIVHRREPDYGNAKDRFHRVGRHLTFPKTGARAEEFFSQRQSRLASRFVRDGLWQPINFVEACAEAAKQPNEKPDATLPQLQKIEFDALLEHICASAIQL